MMTASEHIESVRRDTLARISGLPVTCYIKHGVRAFVFGVPNVKTVCTYRKARAFAEGVAIGRSQEKP